MVYLHITIVSRKITDSEVDFTKTTDGRELLWGATDDYNPTQQVLGGKKWNTTWNFWS